jgi:hypothetical protein
MVDVAHHVEQLPLYYAQAQAEYQRTTDRPRRLSPRRSGLAHIRDQLYFLLACSAGPLAVFRIHEDGSLRRLQSYPPTLHKALRWRMAFDRRPDHVPDIPRD